MGGCLMKLNLTQKALPNPLSIRYENLSICKIKGRANKDVAPWCYKWMDWMGLERFLCWPHTVYNIHQKSIGGKSKPLVKRHSRNTEF